MNKRKSPKKPKVTKNEYGITYREWCDLACVRPSPEARKAWEAGEDPSEYHPSVKVSDS